jgi:hypothetical protein
MQLVVASAPYDSVSCFMFLRAHLFTICALDTHSTHFSNTTSLGPCLKCVESLVSSSMTARPMWSCMKGC